MERITPLQAGRRLGVTPETIAHWFDAGYLSGTVLPSGRRRIDVDAVDRVAVEGARPSCKPGMTPAAWLHREISSGRLAATPTDELLAVLADAIRGRAVLAGVNTIIPTRSETVATSTSATASSEAQRVSAETPV